MASTPISIPIQKPTASARIPPLTRPYVSERALAVLDAVERFVEHECIPADAVYLKQLGGSVEQRFSSGSVDSGNGNSSHAQRPSIMEDLKRRAKELGLWNLFLPGLEANHHAGGGEGQGAGFSNLEYGLMAELLGKSRTASEATNCSAPDTGNMEVLAKYGTEEQKREWLDPLLRGDIRSAFLMTEPDVASSDATNIQLSIRREGDEWVLNGSKWWSSGAGDPRCEIYIVMGKSNPDDPNPYRQQSVILVPAHTPGITVKRMLSVFGYDDAPHGHGHITLENVRVPVANIVLGEGRGFEVVQGRLGPGRIHHAMRCIGAAERALEYFIARATDPSRQPFGKNLSEHGVMLTRIAHSRIDIDAARLVVLNAAVILDLQARQQQEQQQRCLQENQSSPSTTLSLSKTTSVPSQSSAIPTITPTQSITAIASAKLLAARTALSTIDAAIQAHGGAGVSQDTPLAAMWAQARTMRIVDGPDEVHLLQVGRREVKGRTSGVAGTSGTSGSAGTKMAPKQNTERKIARNQDSARQMSVEKDATPPISAASATPSSASESRNETMSRGTDLYDVKAKIEAQRQKSIELGKGYDVDVLKDGLDVQELKNGEMERRRRKRSKSQSGSGRRNSAQDGKAKL